MTPSVGIVIPAYQPDVSVLSEYVESLVARIDPDVIRIELDAPTEGATSKLADLPATVNTASGRRGKGTAITAGFEALDTDVLAFVDADGSTPAHEVERILTPVTDGSADLAVGSRRHPDSTVATSQSPGRELLGDGFAWLARRFLAVNLHDYQCGAKAITAEGWGEVRAQLTRPGFAWDVEFLAVAGAVGLDVREVPIEWHDHPNSTVPPIRTALRLFSAIVYARRKASKLDAGPVRRTVDSVTEDPAPLINRETVNTDR